MTSEELINLIANTWISNGGDATGFNYCWNSICQRIEELENKEDCPIPHGEGVVMDSNDPRTECGGSGKVGG